MNFDEFIKPELLILIPVLYLVGTAIKKSNINNKRIPLILGITGVVIAFVYICAAEPLNSLQAVATAFFTAFTQGVLCAGASVYANQIIKQTKED